MIDARAGDVVVDVLRLVVVESNHIEWWIIETRPREVDAGERALEAQTSERKTRTVTNKLDARQDDDSRLSSSS